MEIPESRKFYGAVTVSERGQIVIPADARKDFGIKTGDKLLVLGDLERGIGLSTFTIMQRNMEGSRQLFHEVVSVTGRDGLLKSKKNAKKGRNILRAK